MEPVGDHALDHEAARKASRAKRAESFITTPSTHEARARGPWQAPLLPLQPQMREQEEEQENRPACCISKYYNLI